MFILTLIIFFLLFLLLYTYWQLMTLNKNRKEDFKKVVLFKKELEEIKIQLEKSIHIKNDFLSIVSHELRTPLSNIKDSVSLVIDEAAGSINETQKKFLHMAMNNINRLTHLIYDILDLSKIEAGRLHLKRKTIDLRQIVKEVYKSLYSKAENKFISFEVNLPEYPLESYIDQSKFTQVITNLVDNALKFTPVEGKISMELKENDGLIDFSIADNGKGIPPSEINRVFEKFFHRGEEGGTGLGLAICKGVVEAHGGKIDVESPPAIAYGDSHWRADETKKGTKFIINIPIVTPPTILIVDDEKNFVQALKIFLEEENYNINVAFDGDEAIEIIRARKPSLILLDIKMPRMNGYKVIEYLFADEKTKVIPIIILSGYEIDTARLHKIGMKKIRSLSKPIENDLLLEEIEAILSSI
jgi:signal transduction histidine kinase